MTALGSQTPSGFERVGNYVRRSSLFTLALWALLVLISVALILYPLLTAL